MNQSADAMTAKELEYIADSMSNEDLLYKQCVVAAATVQNPQIKQTVNQLMSKHTQHYQTLLTMMEQHRQMAPTQPQQ
ncbi:hypothetical protein [Paenibacillus glycinis]|uniref:Spore coat protein n=1 Tax=Paenibacillus glycinis TaxID=2697035 RepID=A0ABW9XKS6_9BACL|nr:hypothetical protein [Paenibacillus glycinis]NBD23052.1 hypothetical protein [Paenibacillus glycinis]